VSDTGLASKRDQIDRIFAKPVERWTSASAGRFGGAGTWPYVRSRATCARAWEADSLWKANSGARIGFHCFRFPGEYRPGTEVLRDRGHVLFSVGGGDELRQLQSTPALYIRSQLSTSKQRTRRPSTRRHGNCWKPSQTT